MRPHRVTATLLVALALAACGDDPSSPPQDAGQLDLVGRTFVGDQVTVDDAPRPLVSGSQIRLTFEDGNIGASAGCNQMGGKATWDDGVLQARNLFSTEMACDPPLMDQDTWLADFLTSDPTVTEDAGTLTLTSGGTVMVLSDEADVAPPASLTGTLWTLDAIVTGDTVGSVPSGVTSTLRLTPDGRVQVRPGCNTGNGSYSATDTTITFDPIATTLMACPAPAMDVEDTVLRTLRGDVLFSIDGDSLNLTPQQVKGDGATGLVYRAG